MSCNRFLKFLLSLKSIFKRLWFVSSLRIQFRYSSREPFKENCESAFAAHLRVRQTKLPATQANEIQFQATIITMLPSRKPTIMPSLYLPLLLKKTNKQRKQLTTTTKACQKNAGSKTNSSTNQSTSNRCAKYLLMKGCRQLASLRVIALQQDKLH